MKLEGRADLWVLWVRAKMINAKTKVPQASTRRAKAGEMKSPPGKVPFSTRGASAQQPEGGDGCRPIDSGPGSRQRTNQSNRQGPCQIFVCEVGGGGSGSPGWGNTPQSRTHLEHSPESREQFLCSPPPLRTQEGINDHPGGSKRAQGTLWLPKDHRVIDDEVDEASKKGTEELCRPEGEDLFPREAVGTGVKY